MKQFDADSVKARLLESLQSYVDPVDNSKLWRRILNDSAIQSLLTAISEDTAEQSRYFEYLLKEAMWASRKNRSSALKQISFFGYQPHRKISAIGEIYVSHDALFASAGQDLFLRIEDDKETFVDYTGEPALLTPYRGQPITIAAGTKVGAGAVNFFTTQSLTYTNTVPTTTITVTNGATNVISGGLGHITVADILVEVAQGDTPSEVAAKIRSTLMGSATWTVTAVSTPSPVVTLTFAPVDQVVPVVTLVDTDNTGVIGTVVQTSGTLYAKIPVMQGLQRVIRSSQAALGTPLETIKILSNSIEAALDDTSKVFFTVKADIGNGSTPVVEILEDILLASPNQLACHIRTSPDFSYITLTFGDGTTGRILPVGTIIEVSYVETLGADGNVQEDNAIDYFENPTLYCTNFSPLQGGTADETLESIRELGPQYYLIGDRSIVTQDAYVANIEALPGVLKAAVSSRETTQGGIVQKAIFFTAFGLDGKRMVKAEIEQAFVSSTVNRRSPLDYVAYENPNALLLNMGVTANTNKKDVDKKSLETTIKNTLSEMYSLNSSDFGNSYDTSAWIQLVRDIGASSALRDVDILTEAAIELPASEFVVSTNPSRYEHEFMFDSSFEAMKDFTEAPYVLKIQILFLCEGCIDNSRTLFAVPNPNYTPGNQQGEEPYIIKQYYYIDRITTASYMNNYVLAPNQMPNELLYGDPDYINISVQFDYDSSPRLYAGRIAIPLKKSIDVNYLNFATADSDLLDSSVSIKIMAEPVLSHGIATEYNDIFYTDAASVQVEVSSV